MKKINIIFYLLSVSLFAQQETLKVTGKNLTMINGETIVLRGINYPIIDHGAISLSNAAQYQHKIDEAAKTGANSIRIPWYTNERHWRDEPQYGGPGIVSGYVNNGHLSNLIGYCYQKGMIPILEIHDPKSFLHPEWEYVTCSNDWNYFNTTVKSWWQSQVILDLIEEHKEYLIINPANEFGMVRWTDNQAVALTQFQTNYNQFISEMRNLGVTVPIMIDAPDCGQSSTELLSVAEAMVTADSEHNLIFSAHAYWYGYASTLTQIQTKLDEAQNNNVCYILGEVASTQEGNSCGEYSLASIYPLILEEACNRNIGWLAWTYDEDCSAPRKMTLDGEFNTLTTYGNDLVYNSVYGLKSTQGCGAQSLNISKNKLPSQMAIYPNPSKEYIKLSNSEEVSKIVIYDMSGRMIEEISNQFQHINIAYLLPGTYLLEIQVTNSNPIKEKLIKL